MNNLVRQTMRLRMRFNKERQMRLRAFINRQSKKVCEYFYEHRVWNKLWKFQATSVAVHICMILGVTLYTIFGALIMQRIESQQIQKHKLHQQQQHSIGAKQTTAVPPPATKFEFHKHPIRHARMANHENGGDCLGPIIKALRHTHCNGSALRQLDHCHKFLMEREMQREESRHMDEKHPIRFGWSFTDSVLFCFTVITTIGYGNVAPKTFQGQLFCILYALIGIPFTLLAIADLGKFLSEILEGWERTCRSAKRQVQRCWRDFRAQPKKFSFISLINAQNGCILDPNNNNPSFMERLQVLRGNKSNATTPATDTNPLEETLLDKAERGEAAPSADRNSKTGQDKEEGAEGDDEQHNANDDESQHPFERSQTIPLLLMFIIYVFIGACLLCAYEPDMHFFKAIYFNFVSLTSIGLGDVVPQSETYMAFTLAYIAIGLALTTIAVEIAAEYLKKLHYFGRKIENVGNVAIWFGSKRLTVKQLVKNLGDQFNLPVHQIKTLDLDNFVDNAIKVEEGELETLRAPPFEAPKEEELTFADDEAIIEWEPQKTPSTSTEHDEEEQQPPEQQVEPEEPEPEPEPPEPEPEPEPEPPEPEPEEPFVEVEIVEELALDLAVEQPTPSTSERRKSNYSDEAWRRYLEYQKQWKKFRHTQTAGTAASTSATDIEHASPKRPSVSSSSPRAKSSLDTKPPSSTTARGTQKLSLANRDQSSTTMKPLRQKKTSRTSAEGSENAFGQQQKMSAKRVGGGGGGTTTK